MKLSILLLLLLWSLHFSQELEKTNGIFEYEQIESRNKGFKSHIIFFNLTITNLFSTYTQIYTKELDEEYIEDNEGSVNEVIVVKPKKDEMKIVFNNFENNLMYFKDIVAFDKIYVKEDKFKMEWKIVDETRKYGKRICKKATTEFRGRTYTAWYLPEISTEVGPWKFINPPGLIYEIYDADKILHIKLNKFNTKKQSKINSWDNEKNKKIIDVKKYVKLKEKAEEIILERLNSKLPKGSAPFIKNTEQKEIEIFN